MSNAGPDPAPDPGRDPGSDPGAAGFEVDDAGVTVPAADAGAWQVAFDGRVVLTVRPKVADGAEGSAFARWDGVTPSYLHGRSHVELRRGERTVDLGERGFGRGPGRVSFTDAQGGQVIIDKWGLAQRPFHMRGTEVPRFLAEKADELCRIARERCGIELWMAFGTLLGAARSGGVIAHDSDVDLAYLSDEDTPARMTEQMGRLQRVLREEKLRCVAKTGSFLTVLYEAPDGAEVSIDIYICFFFEGQLFETASARAPVAREAILPLSTMPFEGVELPAPHDPAALLEVSYGPRWQRPDPDFSHAPSQQIRSRFDGWFGNLMRRRRDWEAHWVDEPTATGPSPFAEWVMARTDEDVLVVDVGMGQGNDAVGFAATGRHVLGLDYARTAGAAIRMAREEYSLEELRWSRLNLYDLRDVVSAALRVFERPEQRRVVYARGLLESLRPQESDYFWVLVRMLCRGDGGRLALELDQAPGGPGPGHDGVWRFPASRDDALARATAMGLTLVEEERVPPPPGSPDGTSRWRMLLAGS